MQCFVLFYTLTVLTLGFSHCYNETKTNLIHKCGLQENLVSVTDFPWVSLISLSARTYPGGSHRCVGALINERYVITSSVCLMFAMKHVNIGELQIAVQTWRVHPSSNVAILKLQKDVEFSDTVVPICLPYDEFKKPEEKNTFFTGGWGTSLTEPKIMENKKVECNDNSTNSLCLGHISKNFVCEDDQGGPVMYRVDDKWILYGFLSSPIQINGCAENVPMTAVVITDDILNWIEKWIET